MLKHILLPLDGSSLAERVLPHAVSLAKAFNSEITLLRVVYSESDTDQPELVNPIKWKIRKSEAEGYLESVHERIKKMGLVSNIKILEGKPAQQITDYANNQDVDLIILSSHGKSGPSEWNINSTVQKILLRAYIPVMIIRAYSEIFDVSENLKYDRIFLPLDGSSRAECVLPLANSISQKQNARVILAHVIEEPRLPKQTPLTNENEILLDELNQINHKEAENYLSEIRKQFISENTEIIIESSKHTAATMHRIIDREKVDLVILSAHGQSGENMWPYGRIALNFIVFGTVPLIIIQDLTENDFGKTLAEKYTEQSKGH